MYGIPTGREGRVRVLLYVTACGTCSTSSDDNPQGQLYKELSFPRQYIDCYDRGDCRLLLSRTSRVDIPFIPRQGVLLAEQYLV